MTDKTVIVPNPLFWLTGTSLFDQEKYKEAIRVFEKLPQSSKTHYNIGICHLNLGEPYTAIQSFKNSIELDKYLCIAYFQLAYAYQRTSDYHQATKSYDAALMFLGETEEIQFHDVGLRCVLLRCEVLFNLALCLRSAGDKEASLRAITQARSCSSARTTNLEAMLGKLESGYLQDVSPFQINLKSIFKNPVSPSPPAPTAVSLSSYDQNYVTRKQPPTPKIGQSDAAFTLNKIGPPRRLPPPTPNPNVETSQQYHHQQQQQLQSVSNNGVSHVNQNSQVYPSMQSSSVYPTNNVNNIITNTNTNTNTNTQNLNQNASLYGFVPLKRPPVLTNQMNSSVYPLQPISPPLSPPTSPPVSSMQTSPTVQIQNQNQNQRPNQNSQMYPVLLTKKNILGGLGEVKARSKSEASVSESIDLTKPRSSSDAFIDVSFKPSAIQNTNTNTNSTSNKVFTQKELKRRSKEEKKRKSKDEKKLKEEMKKYEKDMKEAKKNMSKLGLHNSNSNNSDGGGGGAGNNNNSPNSSLALSNSHNFTSQPSVVYPPVRRAISSDSRSPNNHPHHLHPHSHSHSPTHEYEHEHDHPDMDVTFGTYPYPLPISPKNDRSNSLSGDSWEINFQEIHLAHEIGRGAFGRVYQGTWRNALCCVKVANPETSQESMVEFLKEANSMKKMRSHPNVCQLFGVCASPVVSIVMELLPEGSLFNILHNPNIAIDLNTGLSLLKDTCSGMIHLHAEGILHLDLATRNLLVKTEITGNVTKYNIKISDFGMSSTLSSTGEIYDVSARNKFPIRWCAPEIASHRQVTKASDVWSYGVVAWEIFERKFPYIDMSNQEVIELVFNQGYRLPKPNPYIFSFPNELYQLMLKCWEMDPNKRPNFTQIYEELLQIEKKIQWLNSNTNSDMEYIASPVISRLITTTSSLSSISPSNSGSSVGSSFNSGTLRSRSESGSRSGSGESLDPRTNYGPIWNRIPNNNHSNINNNNNNNNNNAINNLNNLNNLNNINNNNFQNIYQNQTSTNNNGSYSNHSSPSSSFLIPNPIITITPNNTPNNINNHINQDYNLHNISNISNVSANYNSSCASSPSSSFLNLESNVSSSPSQTTMLKRFCSSCGKNIKPTDVFCSYCGNKIHGDE